MTNDHRRWPYFCQKQRGSDRDIGALVHTLERWFPDRQLEETSSPNDAARVSCREGQRNECQRNNFFHSPDKVCANINFFKRGSFFSMSFFLDLRKFRATIKQA